MANFTKLPYINGGYGTAERIHGIYLPNLPIPFKRFLLRNKYIKFIKRKFDRDVSVIYALYIVNEIFNFNKAGRAVFPNYYTNSITTYNQIEKDSLFYPWTCAICGTPIRCNTETFDATNFCCESCAKVFCNAELVDGRIIASSRKFSVHMKQLYTEQNTKTIRYMRKNFKRNVK